MLRTPNSRTTVAALCAVLYATAPIVEWFYYSSELALGSYPADADSIGLPMGLFILVWVIGAPLAGALIWFVLRSYPGSVPLFGFNDARPYWSIGWSVLFAVLIFQDVVFCLRSVSGGRPLDVAQSVLLGYLFLCLRSSIVYGGLSHQKGNTAIVSGP